MKAGRSLVELAQELERQLQTKRDFIAPTHLLTVSPAEEGGDSFNLTMGRMGRDEQTQTLPLNRHAETQIREYADIPAKYFERLKQASPLMAANELNFWLNRQSIPRLIRTLDGWVRAFLSDRYRMIDNYDLAEAALPILMEEPGLQIVSAEVTEQHLYIKATTPRLTFEARPGDIVQAGISIRNSEVGLGAVDIEPLLYQLACSNGAVIENRLFKKYHLGRRVEGLEELYELFRDETKQATDQALLMQIQDVIRAAFDHEEFQRLRGIAIDATTRRIKAPIETVLDRVVEKFDLRTQERDGLLQRLAAGGDLSQWGLASAMTNLANSADDYERASELERAGGTIIALPAPAWAELAEVAVA